MITAFLFLIVFLLLGAGGYLLWAMQQKVDELSRQLGDLSRQLGDLSQQILALTSKVTAGEEVICENFETVEKRYAKLEHEFKEFKNIEIGQRRKEILQAVKTVQRRRNE